MKATTCSNCFYKHAPVGTELANRDNRRSRAKIFCLY